MTLVRYTDVEVGQVLPTRSFPVTRADLVRYAGASGDAAYALSTASRSPSAARNEVSGASRSPSSAHPAVLRTCSNRTAGAMADTSSP